MQNLVIRLANDEDLSWCERQDRQINSIRLLKKIQSAEILAARASDRSVGYLRLEYLWSKFPYIFDDSAGS